MWNRVKGLLLVPAFAAAACAPGAYDDQGPAADASGLHARGKAVHRIPVQGIEREFIVYVPLRARGHSPVVFMFHGTSGDGEKFYDISGWREKADAEGLIAVFPSALTYCFHEDENGDGDFDDAGERSVTTKWAAGKLGDPARMPLCTPGELASLPPEKRALADHPLMDDVAFVDAMLAVLANRYSIDARRIYASGFSNGASFTSLLALEKSDRFAAIAAAAGVLGVQPRPAARPVPVLFSVGELDDRFTVPLGVTALPLEETLFVQLPALEALIVTPMLTTLQLGDEYDVGERVIRGKKLIGFRWSQSLVGASNAYGAVFIEGLGHQYPNGTNHPLVMANLLWRFFEGRSLP